MWNLLLGIVLCAAVSHTIVGMESDKKPKQFNYDAVKKEFDEVKEVVAIYNELRSGGKKLDEETEKALAKTLWGLNSYVKNISSSQPPHALQQTEKAFEESGCYAQLQVLAQSSSVDPLALYGVSSLLYRFARDTQKDLSKAKDQLEEALGYAKKILKTNGLTKENLEIVTQFKANLEKQLSNCNRNIAQELERKKQNELEQELAQVRCGKTVANSTYAHDVRSISESSCLEVQQLERYEKRSCRQETAEYINITTIAEQLELVKQYLHGETVERNKQKALEALRLIKDANPTTELEKAFIGQAAKEFGLCSDMKNSKKQRLVAPAEVHAYYEKAVQLGCKELLFNWAMLHYKENSYQQAYATFSSLIDAANNYEPIIGEQESLNTTVALSHWSRGMLHLLGRGAEKSEDRAIEEFIKAEYKCIKNLFALVSQQVPGDLFTFIDNQWVKKVLPNESPTPQELRLCYFIGRLLIEGVDERATKRRDDGYKLLLYGADKYEPYCAWALANGDDKKVSLFAQCQLLWRILANAQVHPTLKDNALKKLTECADAGIAAGLLYSAEFAREEGRLELWLANFFKGKQKINLHWDATDNHMSWISKMAQNAWYSVLDTLNNNNYNNNNNNSRDDRRLALLLLRGVLAINDGYISVMAGTKGVEGIELVESGIQHLEEVYAALRVRNVEQTLDLKSIDHYLGFAHFALGQMYYAIAGGWELSDKERNEKKQKAHGQYKVAYERYDSVPAKMLLLGTYLKDDATVAEGIAMLNAITVEEVQGCRKNFSSQLLDTLCIELAQYCREGGLYDKAINWYKQLPAKDAQRYIADVENEKKTFGFRDDKESKQKRGKEKGAKGKKAQEAKRKTTIKMLVDNADALLDQLSNEQKRSLEFSRNEMEILKSAIGYLEEARRKAAGTEAEEYEETLFASTSKKIATVFTGRDHATYSVRHAAELLFKTLGIRVWGKVVPLQGSSDLSR